MKYNQESLEELSCNEQVKQLQPGIATIFKLQWKNKANTAADGSGVLGGV